MTDKSVFTKMYFEVLEQNDLRDFATETIADKFYDFMCLLIESNKKFNLTAITDPHDIIVKHFADSLKIVKYIPSGAKALDVGCGGGFPSIPVALVRQDITLHALDSTEKKLVFVAQAAEKLGLKNLTTIKSRAEELARNEMYREKYDFVCARGVSRLNVLSELCLPFVKRGGIFAAMKAADTQAELSEAQNAIKTLAAEINFVDEFLLDGAARSVIITNKVGKTPSQFPREYNKILKSPL